MNWGMIISALVIAAAIVISAKEIALAIAATHRHRAVAVISSILMAARLTDQEYANRVDSLRKTVKYGLEFYPGSGELVKQKEEEIEIAKQMLRECDYESDAVRERWISLATAIYEGSAIR
jgi:hypothetical protein